MDFVEREWPDEIGLVSHPQARERWMLNEHSGRYVELERWIPHLPIHEYWPVLP